MKKLKIKTGPNKIDIHFMTFFIFELVENCSKYDATHDFFRTESYLADINRF